MTENQTPTPPPPYPADHEPRCTCDTCRSIAAARHEYRIATHPGLALARMTDAELKAAVDEFCNDGPA